jgi:putative nucleotidyltransferase with HDIG domain
MLLQGAGAALAVAHWGPLPAHGQWALFAVLALLGLAAGALKVELCARWGRITMAYAVTCFTLLAAGPGAALTVNALAALGGLYFNQREGRGRFNPRRVPLYQVLFNVANYLLCVAAAEVVFAACGGRRGSFGLQQAALPVLASSFAYYLVNTGGVAAALAWTGGRPVVQVWRENFAWAGAGYLATACGAAAALLLYQNLPVGPALLLLLPPSYLVLQSYRIHVAKIRADVEHMRAVNRLSQSIITSLAMAIDAKDRTTHRHIHRVREYAVAVAERLRVPEADLEAVKIASLLHDIGKLGISEKILCKPDKLTPDEFNIIRSHVDMGARILEPVDFPWPVIPIVLTHHERWDGLGYPRGLRGEEIPIGGRIVALADVYDALTSDRPYRKAMDREGALEMVRAGAGTQFDPAVVEAFAAVLPGVEARIRALEAEAGAPPPLKPWLARELAPAAEAASAAGALSSAPRPPQPEPGAPEREVLDWLVDSLRASLPASTLSIYLADAPGRELRAVRCEGLLADRWRGVAMPLGEGAAGYAAARDEVVLNAPASLDLARRVKPGENLELSSALILPLAWEGRRFGAAALYHTSYEIFDRRHAAEGERLARAAARLLAEGEEQPGLTAPPVRVGPGVETVA